jgi:hypothetical protein
VRRSARISKEIPILLIGSDLDGRMFSEPTSTVLLSLHGAALLSRHKLSPEQELVLRWPEKNKEAEIRVVGHIGEQSGRHAYGVAFFGQNLNFWEIDFPPVSEMEKQLGLLSLVCGSCKTLEKVDDASFEADICAASEGVLRYCKRCGSSTLWKPSPRRASAIRFSQGCAVAALLRVPRAATRASPGAFFKLRFRAALLAPRSAFSVRASVILLRSIARRFARLPLRLIQLSRLPPRLCRRPCWRAFE